MDTYADPPLSPRWDSTHTLASLRAGMRFAILEPRKREVTIVHGSHPAPDHPTAMCYDGVALEWDGEGVALCGDPTSTGGTFLQDGVHAGRLEVTLRWEEAMDLLRSGAR